ncbi:MAG: pitrilysin family protein [Pseudomonadota bacterium]
MRKHKTFLTVLIITLSLALSVQTYAFNLKNKVKEFKLKNGMRWLLVQRNQAPVFSGVVMLRVGGADEEPGKTGLAHMFEHMAFKGSSQLGPNEIWEIMSRNGAADLNAFTSKDVTAYHASMPSNKLGLWLNIMSQIVTEPVFDEFYTERDVVLEERRNSIENNPVGKMLEVLLDKSYNEGPYAWPIIGELSDVSSFTVEDASQFHQKYYVASNMVGVLVGDFNLKQAQELIAKYFEIIPQADVPKMKSFFKSGGSGQHTLKFDAEPALAMSYHKSTLPDPDEFVFDVIEVILCHGPTSRLQKRLVYQEKIASDIYCSNSYPGSRFDNLFLIFAEPTKSHSLTELSQKIKEELNRLKTEPVSEEELERVRNNVAATIIYSMENNDGLAMQLAQFETIFGDWKLLPKYPKKIEQVNIHDIERVAKKYFTDNNLTEVERVKK